MKFKRIFLIVLDSLGIGNGKDAAKFGDEGTDTFLHITEKMPSFSIPNLEKLGMGNLKALKGVSPVEKPLAKYYALNEASNGKDTMTGHWEMMGIKTEKPFITFTDTGFPPALIQELEEKTGRKDGKRGSAPPPSLYFIPPYFCTAALPRSAPPYI